MVPWRHVAEVDAKRQSLKLLSDPCNAADLRESVRRFLEGAGLEARAVDELVLAVNEAFANIVDHSYGGRCDGRIEVDLHDTGEAVEVVLRDFGRKPELETLKPRDLEDVRPGGLGLHFIDRCTDEAEWDLSPTEGTRLRLVRRKEGKAD